MKVGFKFSFLLLSLLGIIPVARAQAPISSMSLGPDQIGKVRTAPGITTKISFPDKVFESICGDLYDSASGKGTFVIQQSGNDVFLKPIAPRGMSNLFVKVGDNGKYTYNFDLEVVTVAQAHRVVNVTQAAAPAQPSEAAPRDSQPPSNGVQPTSNQPTVDQDAAAAEKRQAMIEQARKDAAEILRNAQQQADRILSEAQARQMDHGSAERSKDEVERRFVKALMLGLREAKINNPRVQAKKIIITLDPRVLTLDDKSYLRYTIQNAGTTEFAFNSISLETEGEGESKPVTIQIIQNKAENKLEANESLAGVIIFDASSVTAKDRLRLYVRGEDSAEIARVNIQ
ncbi:MAG TPA: hypothetical protein VKA70_05955 [Blastocatellia bacterium]|nr:hypothetical protein [Blastocatellia bacterium]